MVLCNKLSNLEPDSVCVRTVLKQCPDFPDFKMHRYLISYVLVYRSSRMLEMLASASEEVVIMNNCWYQSAVTRVAQGPVYNAEATVQIYCYIPKYIIQ